MASKNEWQSAEQSAELAERDVEQAVPEQDQEPGSSIQRNPTKYRFGEALPEGGGVDVEQGCAEFTALGRRISHKPQPENSRSSASSDTAVGDDLEANKKEDGFDLARLIKSRRAQMQEDGIETDKPLGVIWKNLTVKGVGSTASFAHTLDKAIIGSFGPNVFNVLCKQFPSIANKIPGRHVPVRNLIEDFSGCLKDEMLLVLGSPGSGCSTFLKVITN